MNGTSLAAEGRSMPVQAAKDLIENDQDQAIIANQNPMTRRVVDATQRAGIPFSLRTLPRDAADSDDIAELCGCDVDLVVKICVYKGKTTKKPLLFLVSGKNQVDERAMSTVIGEVLEKARPELVQRLTGFEIGHVPPLGHVSRMPVLMDDHLLRFSRVWCSAGAPNMIMSVPTHVLARAVAARIVRPD